MKPIYYIIARFYEQRQKRLIARYYKAVDAAEKFFRKAGL